jgi:cytochrome c553
MKHFLTIVCSLFLIGCGDSAQTDTSAVSQNETQPVATATETNASVQPSTAATETAAPVVAANAPATVSASESKTPAPVMSVDGSTLFGQKCASCHGMKAEKSALGKSQVIAGWSEQQVKEALKGYQAGTYGKEMKALMQGQAKPLSDAQIDALAKHISGL